MDFLTPKTIWYTVLGLVLVYSAIGAYGNIRSHWGPPNCVVWEAEEVKIMCWNQLTQQPRECK